MLSNYYKLDSNSLTISADQASRFAKGIAGDFNPLHDPNNRRFCVPGDLLFTVMLKHYGISQNMHFKFADMVRADVELHLEEDPGDACEVRDADGKTYLHLDRSGDITHNDELIERLATAYVAFSGQGFPHLLVPLMQEQNVMINTDRPMVIYESMNFELQRVDIPNVELRLKETELKVTGKRGGVRLVFEFLCGEQVVGTGCKHFLLSGLRPYNQEAMDVMVTNYLARREQYQP